MNRPLLTQHLNSPRSESSPNHLRSRHIERVIDQWRHAFDESHRMRQSGVILSSNQPEASLFSAARPSAVPTAPFPISRCSFIGRPEGIRQRSLTLRNFPFRLGEILTETRSGSPL